MRSPRRVGYRMENVGRVLPRGRVAPVLRPRQAGGISVHHRRLLRCASPGCRCDAGAVSGAGGERRPERARRHRLRVRLPVAASPRSAGFEGSPCYQSKITSISTIPTGSSWKYCELWREWVVGTAVCYRDLEEVGGSTIRTPSRTACAQSPSAISPAAVPRAFTAAPRP